MIDDPLTEALAGALWALSCLLLFLAALRAPARAGARVPRLWALCGLAALVRLGPLLLFAHTHYDVQSYAAVARSVLGGHDVYTDASVQGRYPYLPAQLWLSALALALSHASGLPFVILAKIPGVLGDALIAPALLLGLRRAGRPDQAAQRAALLYALCPVGVLVSAYQGQFDSLPLLGLVAAWALLQGERPTVAGAGLALGCAILLKGWPVLLVPLYLGAVPSRAARGRLGALLVAVPLVASALYALVYHTPPRLLLGTVLGYGSSVWNWGAGLVLTVLQSAGRLSGAQVAAGAHLSSVLVLAACGLCFWRSRALSLPARASSVLLVFYALSAGFGYQYLAWIVPFLLLELAQARTVGHERLRVLLGLFVTLATLALVLFYLADGAIVAAWPLPSWHGHAGSSFLMSSVWLLVLLWAGERSLPRKRNDGDERSAAERSRPSKGERGDGSGEAGRSAAVPRRFRAQPASLAQRSGAQR